MMGRQLGSAKCKGFLQILGLGHGKRKEYRTKAYAA